MSPVASCIPPELAGKLLLCDVVAERTRTVPIHVNGVGLVRYDGIASGIEYHIETTSAATIAGLFPDNIVAAASILTRDCYQNNDVTAYDKALFRMTGDLEEATRKANMYLPQGLEDVRDPATGEYIQLGFFSFLRKGFSPFSRAKGLLRFSEEAIVQHPKP